MATYEVGQAITTTREDAVDIEQYLVEKTANGVDYNTVGIYSIGREIQIVDGEEILVYDDFLFTYYAVSEDIGTLFTLRFTPIGTASGIDGFSNGPHTIIPAPSSVAVQQTSMVLAMAVMI